MEINVCYGCMQKKEQPGPCPHCGFDESCYVPESYHLPPGTVLYGKYLIGRVLGEGGFGITYVGRDLNLDLKIAVKEYYPGGVVTRDCARDLLVRSYTGQRENLYRDGLEKFINEARRLAKFWGMPGIVSVKDYFQENKTAYIVMEFAEGRTLKEILKNAPLSRLPAGQVFEMMRPVMDALETVHSEGIIHRDISPDNLMVDPKGRVRLLDFGAARSFMAAGEKSLSVVLKPGYAPAEQYRSRGNQGPWTDVYGLCATMYRAITGQAPEESLDRLESDTLKKPSQMGIAIEPRQEEALMKGLAVPAKERFQSAGELRDALYTPSDSEGDPKPQKASEIDADEPKHYKRHKHRKRTAAVIAGVAVALAVIVCALFLWSTAGNPKQAEAPVPETETGTGRGDDGAFARDSDTSETGASGRDSAVAETADRQAAVWADRNMERLVRKGLGRPEGDIYEDELAGIKVLKISGNGVFISDEGSGAGEDVEFEGLSSDETIGSLEDLRYFPQLTVLEISDHSISDITALKSLAFLTALDLSANEINVLNEIESLHNLETLDVSGNNISDLSPLSGLDRLTVLNVNYNPVSGLEPLSGLKALEELYLDADPLVGFGQVSDLSPLKGADALRVLTLSGNAVRNLSPLAGLKALEGLDVSHMDISDVQPLSALTGLTSLDLGYTAVVDVSPLASLVHLEYLNLNGTGLQKEDLSCLAHIPELEISLSRLEPSFSLQ